MPATTYMKNLILNYNFGSISYTPTTPLWFGLSYSTVPTNLTADEPPAAYAYLRSPITTGYANTTAGWTTSTAGSLSNKIAISFPQSTGVWSTTVAPIRSLFIADNGTRASGNILWYSNLSPVLVIPTSTTTTFAIGSIVVTLTTDWATTETINNVLNFNFGAQAYSPANPATMYFGLSTAAITAAGLTSTTEPATASAYARVAFTNNQSSHWHNSTASSTHNDIAISFPACATGDWGTIRGIFIANSASRATGNVLWYHNFTSPFAIQVGATLTFPTTTGVVVTM